ncbi:MAG: glycosyltransferase family 4 protein [Promethearchaeota archaeon]
MNILYVTPLFYPHIGGSEIYTEVVANEMKKKGNKTVIFTSEALDLLTMHLKKRNVIHKKNNYRRGVPVFYYPLFYFNGIDRILYPFRHFLNKERFQRTPISDIIGGCIQNPFSPKLCKELITYGANFELIHVVNILGSHTFYAYLASKTHKVPLVITPGFHLHNPAYTQPRFHSVLKNSEILAHTTIEATFYRNIGIPADRIHKVGFGVDVKKYESGSRKEFREKYNLDEDAFVILFLGRLDPRKGVIHLYKAVQEAIKSNDNIRLFFVGPKSTSYGTNQITKFISSFNKKTSVARYLGILSERDKIDALNGSDVLAMPSIEESLGIVYLEAWAASKPVIGADIPAMREIINDGSDGFLVKFGNISALKDRILTLTCDKVTYAQMCKNGKRKVTEEYNWSLIVRKILKIYENLVK